MLGNLTPTPHLATTDLANATKFYERLGLKVTESTEGYAVLRAGDMDLFIYEHPEPTPSERTSLGWFVSDFQPAYDAAKAAGVSFLQYDEGPFRTDEHGVATREDGGRACWFKDPDGHIIVIAQE